MEVLMRYLKISGVLAAGLLTLGAASSQQTPPTENKGVLAKSLGAMDLGGEIDGLSGRQLRMRYITMRSAGFEQVCRIDDVFFQPVIAARRPLAA